MPPGAEGRGYSHQARGWARIQEGPGGDRKWAGLEFQGSNPGGSGEATDSLTRPLGLHDAARPGPDR